MPLNLRERNGDYKRRNDYFILKRNVGEKSRKQSGHKRYDQSLVDYLLGSPTAFTD